MKGGLAVLWLAWLLTVVVLAVVLVAFNTRITELENHIIVCDSATQTCEEP